jgi:hypothetical protein
VERRLRLDQAGEIAPGDRPTENVPPSMMMPPSDAVAAHELRQRVDDHVSAETERLEQERRSHRVVRDDRNAARVGQFAHSGKIDHVAGGIAAGLAEHRLRPFVDQRPD